MSRSLLPILLADPTRLADLPPQEATAALVELAAIQTALAARLHASTPQATRAADREPVDRLLKPEEAAECMGVTLRWLYRRADKLPFARRLGRKTLRFSEAGMRQYMAEKRG
jgi:predicted DNA-binding transcriptional regulator AlpA